MELKLEDLEVTEDLLEKIKLIQRKHDNKFRISALGEGRLSDGK